MPQQRKTSRVVPRLDGNTECSCGFFLCFVMCLNTFWLQVYQVLEVHQGENLKWLIQFCNYMWLNAECVCAGVTRVCVCDWYLALCPLMSVINLSNSGLKEHSVAVMTHFYAEGRKMGRRPTGVFFFHLLYKIHTTTRRRLRYYTRVDSF